MKTIPTETPVRWRLPSWIRSSTTWFSVATVIVAAALTTYISHAYAIRELVHELEEERRENLELQAERARMLGMIAEATAPAVVYRRASQIGLQEGGPYAATIFVEH